MTVQEILDTLDEYDFDDVDDVERLKMVNSVVQDIEGREPWPFLEADSTSISGDPGDVHFDATGKLTVLTNIRAVLTFVNTGTGDPLGWIRWDEHSKRHAKELDKTGTPIYYFFKGSSLYVWPVPTGGTFALSYLKEQSTLVAGSAESAILIPSKYHDIIVLALLEKLYLKEEDGEIASMYKSLKDEKLITMRQDLWRMQYDRPDSFLMLEDDDADYYE